MTGRRTWTSIAVAVLIVAGLLVLGTIAGGVMFYARHVHTENQPADVASREFDSMRTRFAGQRPVIELRSAVDVVVHRDPIGAKRGFSVLNVLAYDPDTHHLARVDVPHWLLQLTSIGGHVRLARLDLFGNDKLTLDDLEQHGPGLVLDTQNNRGERVLIWTE